MTVFTAVKPFPFTKAEVNWVQDWTGGTGQWIVTVTSVSGKTETTAKSKTDAIKIANKATK